MNAIVLLLVGLLAFLTGVLFYSRFIAGKIFRLDPKFVTPAHEFRDGVDYVPTNRHVLFGHHFTSVAGAAPILGPAIAVIWGWLPAFLWVVLGTVFAGAVHDFAALWISARHKGRSIGTLTESIMGRRARTLFLFIIFFLILMVNAVFALAIANLFMANPGAVVPVWGSLVVAVIVGILIYRTGAGILLPSLGALATLYLLIWFGNDMQFTMPDLIGFAPTEAQLTTAAGDQSAALAAAADDGRRLSWIVVIFAYTFVASVLPVWLLLQPRDYVNGHQLFVALGIIALGVFIVNPEVVAPAVNSDLPAGVSSWFPLLFVTIACGAISGFHGLVGSGTSSKQLNTEPDARYVGYGGAVGEGTLALTSIIACTAGFAIYLSGDQGAAHGLVQWQAHYGSWSSAVAGATTAFVSGVGSLASGVGVPDDIARVFASVVVISFAATSLDTAVRLQRMIITELGKEYKVKAVQNRWAATTISVVACALLALSQDRGAGGMLLWPLFGTTNQLLAGLTLLIVSLYLIRKGRSAWVTLVPMAFLLFMTTWAMVVNLGNYYGADQMLLVGIGAAIFVLEIWLLLEGVAALRRVRSPAEG